MNAAPAAARWRSGSDGPNCRASTRWPRRGSRCAPICRERAAVGAPAHGIMAQGRWKTVRVVEVYSRAEEAGRRSGWRRDILPLR